MNAVVDLDTKATRAAAARRERERLPVNTEIEQALLGAVLRVPKAYGQVAGIVKAEHFFASEHATIWDMIANHQGGEATPTGLSSVANDILEDVGGAGYLHELATNIVTVLNVEDYARQVADLAKRRQIIDLSNEAKDRACDLGFDETADDVAGWVTAEMAEIITVAQNFETAGQVADRVLENLTKPMVYDTTGIRCLDAALGGGFHPGRLYGFAGRYKSGKSFLLSSIGFNQASVGVPAVYLTLESNSEQLVQRLMARRMGGNARAFDNPDNRKDQRFYHRTQQAAEWLKTTGLLIRRRPRMTLDDLKSTLAQIGLSGKYSGVYVDYLQLVGGMRKGSNLTSHYEDVAQTLADAAVNYNIWIAVAAQLNSEGGVRHGEGLMLACDAAFSINTGEDETATVVDSWLKCTANRHGPAMDVGQEHMSPLVFDKKIGPHFRDSVE